MSEGSLQLLTLQHMLLLCLSSCLTHTEFSLPVQLHQPAVQTSSVPTQLHICLCRLHGCTVTLTGVGSGRLGLRGENYHPLQQNVRGLLSLHSEPSHLHCKMKESSRAAPPLSQQQEEKCLRFEGGGNKDGQNI